MWLRSSFNVKNFWNPQTAEPKYHWLPTSGKIEKSNQSDVFFWPFSSLCFVSISICFNFRCLKHVNKNSGALKERDVLLGSMMSVTSQAAWWSLNRTVFFFFRTVGMLDILIFGTVFFFFFLAPYFFYQNWEWRWWVCAPRTWTLEFRCRQQDHVTGDVEIRSNSGQSHRFSGTLFACGSKSLWTKMMFCFCWMNV